MAWDFVGFAEALHFVVEASAALLRILILDFVEADEGEVAPMIVRERGQFQVAWFQRILITGVGRRASDVTMFIKAVQIAPVPDKSICHWVRFSIGFVITVMWIYTVDASVARGTLPQVTRVQVGGDIGFVANVLNKTSKLRQKYSW